jgi:hypothetical protein
VRALRQFWGGQPVTGPQRPPTYCFAEQVPPSRIVPFLRPCVGRVVDLKYIFLYTYNGATFRIPPLSPPWTPIRLGHHHGDVEYVMVRVDADKGKVLEVRQCICVLSRWGPSMLVLSLC